MEFNDKKTATLIYTKEDDVPYGIQIFGHEPSSMAQSAYLLSRGIYNPENINQQLQYLLEELNSTVVMLKQEE